MHRLFSVLLMLLVTAGLAFATGTQEAAPTDETIVTLMSWDTNGPIRQIIADFNESHSGVKIEPQWVPFSEYETRLNTLIAAGDVPDIVQVVESKAIGLGEDGVLKDIAPLLRGDGINFETGYLPGTVLQSGDAVYGVGIAPVMFEIFYNTDVFDQYGVEYPPASYEEAWTWEEFVDAATELTRDRNGNKPGDSGFDPESVVTWGTTVPTWGFILEPLMMSNGGGWLNREGTDFALSSDESIEVLRALRDLHTELNVAPSPAVMDSMPRLSTLLMNGQLAMYIEGHYNVPGFANEGFTDYGFGAMPYFETPSNVAWSSSFSISADASNPDAVWDVFSYFLDIENMTDLYSGGGGIPFDIEWLQDEDLMQRWAGSETYTAPVGFQEMVSTMFDYTVPAATIRMRNYPKIVLDILEPGLQPVLQGQISDGEIREHIKDLEEQALPNLKGWNSIVE